MNALKNMKADAGNHTGPTIYSHAGADVIECKTCGFKHVSPLPSAEVLKAFYEDEFYQAEKPEYLDEAGEDYEWKAVEFGLRFTVASKLLKNKGQRVLDIGSGPGDFLAVAKEKGWDGKGIEPSNFAAEHARERGLDVDTGFFDASTADQRGEFDFIHMSEVLEHVPNPAEILSLAYEKLLPGGVLCVSVPNDFNPLQNAVCKANALENWWVVPDHHLNYFDFGSLEKLITKTGFNVKKRLTNFPMELFLLMGQDYTKDGSLGRKLHGWRKQLDVSLAKVDEATLTAMYEGLAQVEMGRLAVVFAQKQGA